MTLLSAKNLTIRFGGLQAVTDFSLDIDQQELVGLIGPNGAGKTTTFNMLTGIYPPTTGSIELRNVNNHMERISGLDPHLITRKGVTRTFQNIRLFQSMSVWENVAVACHFQLPYSLFQSFFRLPPFGKTERSLRKEIQKLLEIFKIGHKANKPAASLSYGEQRKLEIIRSLASKPRLLLLDEPAAGMNPQETYELMELIHLIRNEYQLAILLIEHDMNLVMGICERLLVLDYGKLIAQGLPDQVRQNPIVIKAYLGEEA